MIQCDGGDGERGKEWWMDMVKTVLDTTHLTGVTSWNQTTNYTLAGRNPAAAAAALLINL